MSDYDRDAMLAEVERVTGGFVGRIPCAADGCDGHAPVYRDGRTTMCDVCGNSYFFTGT